MCIHCRGKTCVTYHPTRALAFRCRFRESVNLMRPIRLTSEVLTILDKNIWSIKPEQVGNTCRPLQVQRKILIGKTIREKLFKLLTIQKPFLQTCYRKCLLYRKATERCMDICYCTSQKQLVMKDTCVWIARKRERICSKYQL